MKAAISIATQEIEWHESNRDNVLTEDYRLGFIKGLYHLRNLFSVAIDADLTEQAGVESNEIIQG